MFIISDREGPDIWSNHKLSEATQYARVSKDATIDLKDKEEVLSLKGKKVVLLIHGICNPSFIAIPSYFSLKESLENVEGYQGYISWIYEKIQGCFYSNENEKSKAYNSIIGYAWPSGLTPLDYYYAKENATLAALRLKNHLCKLAEVADRVDVIAHSMGNKVLFEALDLAQKEGKKPVARVYSCGPAVNSDILEKGRQFENIAKACEQLIIFSSQNDEVLYWPYWVVEKDIALGHTPKKDIEKVMDNVQLVDATDVVDHHRDYFDNEALFRFIELNQLKKCPSPAKAFCVKLSKGKKITIIEPRNQSETYLEIAYDYCLKTFKVAKSYFSLPSHYLRLTSN